MIDPSKAEKCVVGGSTGEDVMDLEMMCMNGHGGVPRFGAMVYVREGSRSRIVGKEV